MHEDRGARGALQAERRSPVRGGALPAARTGAASAPLQQAWVAGGHPLGALGLAGALAGTHHVSRSAPTGQGPVLADLSCAACAPGADELAELAEHHPVLLVVGRTTLGLAEEALHRGALGAVGAWEPVTELRGALGAVSTGQPCTTPAVHAAGARVREVRDLLSGQEREVLRLYGADLPVKTVARRMGITVGTTKEYLKRLRAKLLLRGIPASSKVDVRDLAEELGLLSPGRPCGSAPPGPGQQRRDQQTAVATSSQDPAPR